MFSPCLTYLVWWTRYVLEITWKIWEVFWTILGDTCYAYRQKGVSMCEVGRFLSGDPCINSFILFVSVWKAESTVMCKYLSCWSWHILPKALLCFGLLDALCISDTWNRFPWNHVTGSKDKCVSFILSGLVWGLWSLLPRSCCVMWTRSHVVQRLQLISFLFSVDGLSGHT